MKKTISNPTPGTQSRILKLIQNKYFLNLSLNMMSQIQIYLIQRFYFFQSTPVSLMFNLVSSTSLYFFLSLSLFPFNYMHLSRHDWFRGVADLSQTHHFLSCIWDRYHSIQAFKVSLLDLNFLNQSAIASSLNVWAVPELLFPSVLTFSVLP